MYEDSRGYFSARIHFPLNRVFENFNDPASSRGVLFSPRPIHIFLSDGEHDGVLGMRIAYTHTYKIIYGGLHANTLCDIKRE